MSLTSEQKTELLDRLAAGEHRTAIIHDLGVKMSDVKETEDGDVPSFLAAKAKAKNDQRLKGSKTEAELLAELQERRQGLVDQVAVVDAMIADLESR